MAWSTRMASVAATRLSVASVDLSPGSTAEFFNLATSPHLTNCHVREEEHGTGVTANTKRGERQK